MFSPPSRPEPGPQADAGPPAAAGEPPTTLIVPERFQGPPGTANGGWISGTVAGYLPDSDGSGGSDGSAGTVAAAESVLRAPTPLEVPLRVEQTADDGVRLVHDGTTLVEAHPVGAPDLGNTPWFVELGDAQRAAQAYPGRREHPFPGCLVCGPARAVGDGFRLFAGPLPGAEPGFVAAPWTVHPSLAAPDGTIGRHLVWAALDCPSFWAHYAAAPADRLVALLARQAVSVVGSVQAGQTYVVVARADAVEGRKLRASSALYDCDGRLLAAASALWISIGPPAAGGPSRA